MTISKTIESALERNRLKKKKKPKAIETLDGARESCNRHLSDIGALIFYIYSSQHADSASRSLESWTQLLREAVVARFKRFRKAQTRRGEKTENLIGQPVFDKRQVSPWVRFSSIPKLKCPPTEGLDFRLLNFEICGEGGNTPWQGNLIVIYEAKTDSLFHHFIKTTASSKISKDLIIYVIGISAKKTLERVEGTPPPYRLSISSSPCRLSISSTAFSNKEIAQAYEAAESILLKASALDVLQTFTWRKKNKVEFNFHGWEINHIEHSPPSKYILDIENAIMKTDTARKFSNALTSISKEMNELWQTPESKLQKRIRVSCNGKNQFKYKPHVPKFNFVWNSLNPQKAHKIKEKDWAEKEGRKKREEAQKQSAQ
jgi:hypothetical protein